MSQKSTSISFYLYEVLILGSFIWTKVDSCGLGFHMEGTWGSLLCSTKKWKAEQTEKSTVLLGEDTGKFTLSKFGKTGEQREFQLTGAKTQNGFYHGNQCWGRKNWIVVDKLLEAWCEEVWELKTAGGPRHKRDPKMLWDFPHNYEFTNHISICE